MDVVLGLLVIAALLGIGSRQWRAAIRAKFAERREDREFRERFDL